MAPNFSPISPKSKNPTVELSTSRESTSTSFGSSSAVLFRESSSFPETPLTSGSSLTSPFAFRLVYQPTVSYSSENFAHVYEWRGGGRRDSRSKIEMRVVSVRSSQTERLNTRLSPLPIPYFSQISISNQYPHQNRLTFGYIQTFRPQARIEPVRAY
eukprot:gene21144-25401_t